MGQNVKEAPLGSRWVLVNIEHNISVNMHILLGLNLIDRVAGLLELKQQERLSGAGVHIVTNKCSSCLNMPYVQR